jgi:hypothetical protein
MPDKELMLVPEGRDLAALFADSNGIDKLLAEIEKRARSVVADVSEPKGRKAIASMAFAVARTKTALDDAGKNLVAAEKVRLALIDAERKRVRDRLDTLKADVRRPLDEWEDAEKRRVAQLRARLDLFRDQPCGDSAYAKTWIAWAECIEIDDSYQEFIAEAAQLKDAALRNWRDYYSVTVSAELAEEQAERTRIAEAERLQRERDDRIAREATERAERAAKARAEEEQHRTEARIKAAEDAAKLKAAEYTAKLYAAEDAVRQAQIDAEKMAQAEIRRAAEEQAERQRIKEDRDRKEAADRARQAADAEHRKSIHSAILKGMMDQHPGITREMGIAVIKGIRDKAVPHVTINY